MADAIDPAGLPTNMDAYAGYVDGQWPDYPAISGAHPGVPTLAITVRLANLADCLDIENGDARPADAPTFVQERSAAGVWRPALYGSRDVMPAILGALEAHQIDRAAFRLWSAHYGAGKHVCGPATCGLPFDVDGTQWIDHGTWDESLLSDDFFGDDMDRPGLITLSFGVLAARDPTEAELNQLSQPGVTDRAVVLAALDSADGTQIKLSRRAAAGLH